MLDDIRFTEKVEGVKLLNSLERAMHELKWPFERKAPDYRLPYLTKFEFGLGGFFGNNAWIEPNIDSSQAYDKITVCTQELVADEKYRNNIQRLIMAVNKGVYDFSSVSQAKSEEISYG
jgi:hypothetical protein